MRLNFTLFILLLLSCTANAQKLTGIWRGYFSSSGGIYRGGEREETYKYEIQIEQQSNNGVRGVTFSYKSTVFYGKAELQGIFTNGTKSLLIKETKLVELKIGDKSEPCLMTCYLDYAKIGKMEVLEGTFISLNPKDKSDCGSGKIYLEKVPTSDFKKEDFLIRKKPDDSGKVIEKAAVPKNIARDNAKNKPVLPPPSNTRDKKDNLVTKPVIKPSTAQPQKPTNLPPKVTAPNNKTQDQKAAIAKNKVQPKKDDRPIVSKPPERIQEEPVNSKKQPEASVQQPQSQIQSVPIPKVLVERENNLIKTITTSEEDIQIDLYDNGTIDNDTISVYDNNKLVISHGRLIYSPITVKLKCSKTENRHEIVVVAENLGDIPPNTALMVVRFGKDLRGRQEVFLASNEQRNAKVIINYVPKE
ncbi:MAG: hypothetical protein V4539_08160 [Bacteroidota bacterium]